jgi:hypothetical protein
MPMHFLRRCPGTEIRRGKSRAQSLPVHPVVFGLALLALGSGPMAALPQAAAAATTATEPAEIAFYSTRRLTPEELADLSLRELSLRRNTIFARAGNPFRRTWLREHFTAQPWYQPRQSMDESLLSPLDRENAATIARVEASLGEDELNRRASELEAQLEASEEWSTEIEVESLLLSERLGYWPFDFETAGEPTPLQDPAQLDFLLTVDQLRDFSRRDLRILRNTIYARRGRVFQSPHLAEYFVATSWYVPDPTFTEKRLTALDQTNIRLVRSVEDELGGPVTERDEDWFFQA